MIPEEINDGYIEYKPILKDHEREQQNLDSNYIGKFFNPNSSLLLVIPFKTDASSAVDNEGLSGVERQTCPFSFSLDF